MVSVMMKLTMLIVTMMVEIVVYTISILNNALNAHAFIKRLVRLVFILGLVMVTVMMKETMLIVTMIVETVV